MNSNKKTGTKFEEDFAQTLFDLGFWVHLLKQDNSGQPADLIAVRNSKAYLIDCKVCSDSNKRFALTREEENQILSMKLWAECGNGEGWFAIKIEGAVYMMAYSVVSFLAKQQSYLSLTDIKNYGKLFKEWICVWR